MLLSKKTILVGLVAGLTLLAGAIFPRFTTAQAAPVQIYLPVIKTLILPPADEASTRLTVPPGFAIRIYAQNITGVPRFMAFGPDNLLYVSLMGAGQIGRLADLNSDSLADGLVIVASGLTAPHGLEWHAGWLYVAENDKVSRHRPSTPGGVLDVHELVTNNLPAGAGHGTRTLHFGPDGKLYVSAGSTCNVCVETDPRRAAILRFNPEGSIPADNPFAGNADVRWQAVWATGLRNSVDFLWNDSGQLWADHNGRDGLTDSSATADNLPPEEIVIPVQKGKSHGWPYCYTAVSGTNWPAQAEVLDPQSGLVLPAGFDCSAQHVQPALFTGPAHSAPLGMLMGRQLSFPAQYTGDLFVAYHGSWNTTLPNARDCKVERVIVQNGIPVSSQAFVNGWRAPGKLCGDPATWGRPAGLAAGPDGALYISDDKGGRIYRVVWVGP
jgi:glucose/arabinose dehydrogenase